LSAIILSDDDRKLNIHHYNATVDKIGGSVVAQADNSILLSRTSGGGFDSVFFDDTSFSRGYVVIQYLP